MFVQAAGFTALEQMAPPWLYLCRLMNRPTADKQAIAAAALTPALVDPQWRRLRQEGDGVDAISGKCFHGAHVHYSDA